MSEEMKNNQNVVDYKLDVLVTFYNQEEYVDKALETILSQECNFSYKIIIGDDGSTDNTLKNINKWVSRYPNIISVIQIERDLKKKYIGGFRASRNRIKLLSHVTAPFFVFLDGDDYYTDVSKFQLQINILESSNNIDCIACSHRIEELFENGTKKYWPLQNIPEGKYDIYKYWSDLYFHTDTSVIRSSIIPKLPYELIDNHFNDNMITFVIMQYGYIYYIPKTMACYLHTGNGVWTSGNQIPNYIRNMFLYDLCNIINPTLKRQTDIRFMSAWRILTKERHNLSYRTNNLLMEEAIKKDLVYSNQWCHYNELCINKKALLIIKSLSICLTGYIYKAIRKIKIMVFRTILSCELVQI